MKIRRSARTIMATLSLLSAFTLFTAWHNKAPGNLSDQDQQLLIRELGQKNPGLILFAEKFNPLNEAPGFYVLGPTAQKAWPKSLSRASYSDPLAGLRRASSSEVLIRYRSVEDFLFIIKEAEIQLPGSLRALNFQGFRLLPEPHLALSFRLLFSLVIGVVGLVVVKFYNKKKTGTR